MFAAIRRWLRRPASADLPGLTEGIPAPTGEPAVALLEPEAEEPRVVATVPWPEGDVAAWLRGVLAARADGWLQGLPRDERAGDAALLVDRLVRSDDLGIRQLPAAAQEALAVCNDPSSGLHQLVPLFMKDPTLTQALLKQANSAYFAAGRAPVVGLGDAMQRVGTGGVRSILLGATVQGLLCRPGSLFADMATMAWDHMGRTAPLARALATACNADADEAFALGLLHDVGKLVVFDVATALRTERKRELQLSPGAVRTLLRSVHEPLGGLAVHRWGLGDAAALAVAMHHRAPPPGWRDTLSETLFLAELADLATVRGGELDLQVLWTDHLLTGSAVRVGAILAGSH